MLLAELHGKAIAEAQNNEDCLTSCVFGHLRYLPPSVFWGEFFANAKSVPVDGVSNTLIEALEKQQIRIESYSTLHVVFWPTHPKFGEPDLALVWSGEGKRPLVLFIEAKLWAEKSGTGENDQLARYLSATHDLSSFRPQLPESAAVAVLYITPRESLAEIVETAALYGQPHVREMLFRVQWQDVIVAAEKSLSSEREPLRKLILNNVAEFLRRRGLEYFSGFSIDLSLPLLDEKEVAFYSRRTGAFSTLNFPDHFQIQRGEWTK